MRFCTQTSTYANALRIHRAGTLPLMYTKHRKEKRLGNDIYIYIMMHRISGTILSASITFVADAAR